MKYKLLWITPTIFLSLLWAFKDVNAQTTFEYISTENIDVAEPDETPLIMKRIITIEDDFIPYENEIIEKRTNNSITIDLENGKRRTYFHSHPIAYETPQGWKQLQVRIMGLDTWEIKEGIDFIEYIPTEKATDILSLIVRHANAQATSSETFDEAIDVHWQCNEAGVTQTEWTTCQTNTSEPITTSNTVLMIQARSYSGSTIINRGAVCFDTSNIDDGATISSSTWVAFLDTGNEVPDFEDVYAVPFVPDYVLGMDADDYNNFSTSTNYGVMTVVENNDVWNEITFTNYTWINDDGYSCFGLLMGYDYFNNPSLGSINTSNGFASEEAGSNEHYLMIEWTEEEEEESTSTQATSTLDVVEGLAYSNDISIITGVAYEYSSSTCHEGASCTPTKVTHFTYRISYFVLIYLTIIFIFIFDRLILEMIIRWRNKK